ncbi:MAG TPA: methyltransferase domain-containing protein [Polyangiaceae bacterium]|nr:methyltransferase domain-containing protein [Polyangiaceae bacterium]
MTAKDEIESTLRTEGLAPTGEAVAHGEAPGRRAVLIRGAAPDELVRVRFDPRKVPARGRLLEVVSAGRDRVEPACPYTRECGGCDWMHLTRDAQRLAHLEHVREATGVEAAFHPAAEDLRWRIRARLHVDARGGRVRVGFFGPRSHEPAEVDTCVVLEERIDAARGRVAPLLAGARGEGEAMLALGRSGKPVLMLRWSRELPPEVFGRVDAGVRDGHWDGVRLQCGEARRPADFGDPAPRVEGADGAPLTLAPGGFSQAHAEVNGALARRVAEQIPEGARVVELYAGAGNLSVLLARRAGQLTAVESSEDAAQAARDNLAARGLAARVSCADAARFEIPPSTNVVVLDPPRTGAREACERLAHRGASRGAGGQARVRHIIYVSCDLATLRRDLGILGEWRVEGADAFEMFPHTSHVETVVRLERRRGKE